MDLIELTSSLEAGCHLEEEQAAGAADLLASADVSQDVKARFLVSLADKGESASEVSGLARRFRELARNPGLEAFADRAIDVCGTGGDKIGSFNISTTVTFVLAAAGVPVFKHGNRSITSKCGSANLLEALGMDLTPDDSVLRRSMEELGFCFMFAPAFHPAFKEIMPVRQALAAKGQRTVFNVLGPLINPARPAYQILGVYSASIMPLMAEVLHALGLKAGLVAHCELEDGRGMDELSVAGMSKVNGFGSLTGFEAAWKPESFSMESCPVEDLLGGDMEENLKILGQLLDGQAPKGLEDTVVCNVAAAFYAIGRHRSLPNAAEEAREILLGGATRQKIEQTKEFFAAL